MRTLAYIVAGVPAAIGVAFVAQSAYVTSDPETAHTAAATYGLIAAVAFGLPAFALAVANVGRRRAAWALAVLAFFAMAANWTNTLASLSGRSAGTVAEAAKAKSGVADARKEIDRIALVREALGTFAAADADAVHAARDAVTSAERTRKAECDKRGNNCRARELDEQKAREALTAMAAAKVATDQAAALDTEAARLRKLIEKAPADPSTNPLGEALASILPVTAASAATVQQALVALILELAIAAILAAPELLRPRHTARVPCAGAERSAPDVQKPVTPAAAPNVIKVLADIVKPADRRKRVEIEDVLRIYVEACKQRGADAASLEAFGAQAKAFADAAGIRVLASGGKVFWCGVKLAS